MADNSPREGSGKPEQSLFYLFLFLFLSYLFSYGEKIDARPTPPPRLYHDLHVLNVSFSACDLRKTGPLVAALQK